MIFSLSMDVSKLPQNVLVPEMFSVLNVPAAKYMLTVSAVCGLSGAALSSFLPGSRIINALSSDRLLPLPADMTRRPVMSVFIFSILVSFGLLIDRNVLLMLVFFTTPLKMIIAVLSSTELMSARSPSSKMRVQVAKTQGEPTGSKLNMNAHRDQLNNCRRNLHVML
ncbi:hypothetical protein NECAME_06172 [Necator americanus]|uniref:Amino acid permease/ SLC12A domain-containing protein n=1 Tax=Necator americanus TaxID=51031 RepID=W2TVN2_NECAM|nr:hypothetical protein NECAME_06172 [Necator americanus]ETN85858.1 hypothetical protein NECAME_06172 [Necator americanus]